MMMMIESPEGPVWPYDCGIVNNSDEQRFLHLLLVVGFGPEPEPTEATDAEVREAIEAAEQREPAEATDDEVRAIFADRDEQGRDGRAVAALEEER